MDRPAQATERSGGGAATDVRLRPLDHPDRNSAQTGVVSGPLLHKRPSRALVSDYLNQPCLLVEVPAAFAPDTAARVAEGQFVPVLVEIAVEGGGVSGR